MAGIAGESASKRRIREGALRVFAKRGLSGLTMKAIASAVGVTAPAIYRHYRNREAVVSDIAETGFLGLLARFQEPITTDSGTERVLELADRYIRWALENPSLVELVYDYDVQLEPSPLERPAEHATQSVLAILVAEIEQCMESGAWRQGSAPAAAVMLWGLARGMFMLFRTHRINIPDAQMPAFFRQTILLAIDGLRVH